MEFGRREQLILLLIAVAVAFGFGAKYALNRQRVVEAPAVVTEKPAAIWVHVAGAVYHAGVYRLTQGSRVLDAVRRAVPRPDADVDALNLAQPLEDGQKVVVPARIPVSEQLPAGTGNPFAGPVTHDSSSGGVAGGRININTADTAALETLPGVGPALAQRIVTYRQTHGPFTTVEDLLNVPGVGEKKLAQLKEYVTIH
ncbi:ComEA family DNA-binding protein [Thermodesulfitimonas sp.]